MARTLYDVYDRDGNKLIGEMTSSEIAKALDVSSNYVAKCACDEVCLRNKYKIVKKEEKTEKKDSFRSLLLTNWDKIRAPFLEVIWVKEYGPGVRKLNAQRR